jgi:hypothetical protein
MPWGRRLSREGLLADVQFKILENCAVPNSGHVLQVVLKDGTPTSQLATVFEIREPSLGGHLLHDLRLDRIDKNNNGSFAKPERSMCLESDEVESLLASSPRRPMLSRPVAQGIRTSAALKTMSN